MTVTPQGELYVTGYNTGTALHVKPGVATPLLVISGLSTMSTWSIASSRDGRFLFIASGGGDSGRITRVNLSDPNAPPEGVWTVRPGGLGVFLATVGALQRD